MNWEQNMEFHLLSNSKFNNVYTLLFSVELTPSYFPNATIFENIHVHINDLYENSDSYHMYVSGEVYDVSENKIIRKRIPLSSVVHSKEQERAFLSKLEKVLLAHNILKPDYVSQES